MSEHSRCTDSAFELCPRTEAGNEATPGACLGDFFVHFVPFIGHAAISLGYVHIRLLPSARSHMVLFLACLRRSIALLIMLSCRYLNRVRRALHDIVCLLSKHPLRVLPNSH